VNDRKIGAAVGIVMASEKITFGQAFVLIAQASLPSEPSVLVPFRPSVVVIGWSVIRCPLGRLPDGSVLDVVGVGAGHGLQDAGA
jgi:hypothetical protein